MNDSRLIFLAQRLERGAPDMAFCVVAPLSTIADGIGPDADAADDVVKKEQQELKGLSVGASAFGIDGYAVYPFDGDYSLHSGAPADEFLSRTVARHACGLLGLKWDENQIGGHVLFDVPGLPSHWTPELAVIAVRRLLAGEDPWL